MINPMANCGSDVATYSVVAVSAPNSTQICFPSRIAKTVITGVVADAFRQSVPESSAGRWFEKRLWQSPRPSFPLAIQLCIDLGIPLKHFMDYYIESSSHLRYAKLIERGTALAKEKIQTIQKRLSNLEKMQAEIEHSELIQQSEDMVRCNFPAMDVWLAPCAPNAAEPHVFTQFHSLIRMVESSGLTINYFAGRLLHCQGNQKELFFYIGVDIPQGMQDIPETVFHLPAGEYLCCTQAKPAIEDAANIFTEQFALDYEKFVLESELSLGDYDCAAPPFELRCSLPDRQMP